MTKDNENQNNETKNRQEIRKQKEEKKNKKRPKRIYLIPIWARVILIVLFFAASLIAGAMVGYGVVGDGKPMDAITKGPWQNIHDIVFKDTGGQSENENISDADSEK